MAIKPILKYPDKRLNIVAEPIKTFDAELRQLVADMLETMYDAGGVGLAATQINVHKRIVVTDLSEEKNEPKVFINPRIIKKVGQQESEEGCLSVIDYRDVILRAETIVLRYQDLQEQHHQLTDNTFFAICMQHECDHLNGIVYVDRLSKAKQLSYQKKLLKG